MQAIRGKRRVRETLHGYCGESKVRFKSISLVQSHARGRTATMLGATMDCIAQVEPSMTARASFDGPATLLQLGDLR